MKPLRWVKAGDRKLPPGQVGCYAVRCGRKLTGITAMSNTQAMAKAAALYPRSRSLTLTLEGWYEEIQEVTR